MLVGVAYLLVVQADAAVYVFDLSEHVRLWSRGREKWENHDKIIRITLSEIFVG
jgi:hypothetical protein